MRHKFIFCIIPIIFLISCEKETKPVPEEMDRSISEAKAVYAELEKLNPPNTLTYNYRNLISQAEQAKSRGEYQKAIELAKKAKEEAELALTVRKDEINKLKERLDQLKERIETSFMPTQILINKYWDAHRLWTENKYDELDRALVSLEQDLEKELKLRYVKVKTLKVYATVEYVREFGNVRMYQEITPEGKLRGVVDTVPPGAEVLYIRMYLFSPGKSFYYVENPYSKKRGWMAEQYIAPERVKTE